MAVGIAGHDQHAFAGANVAHRLTRLGQIGASLAAFEVSLQVSVSEMRLAAGRECVSDAENDEASALSSVENAGAIVEAAGLGPEFAYLAVLQVKDLDRGYGLRNFLSVSADILYRRAAHTAGDAAQALHSGALRHDGLRDETVPGFAGAGVENNFAFVVVSGTLLDTQDGDLEHQSGPAAIGHEQVAAAAQNKK